MNTFVPGLLPKRDFDRKFLKAAFKPTTEGKPVILPPWNDHIARLLTASDQFDNPICALEMACGFAEWINWLEDDVYQQLDPMPGYKRAKEIDGYPDQDGTTLESAVQALQDIGYLHPIKAERIRSVSTPLEVEQALFHCGPVMGAFRCTDKWAFADSSGWIQGGGNIIGGHAVLICANDRRESPPWIGFMNSWGRRVGCDGAMRMTYPVFEQQFDYGLCIAPNPII